MKDRTAVCEAQDCLIGGIGLVIHRQANYSRAGMSSDQLDDRSINIGRVGRVEVRVPDANERVRKSNRL